MLMLGMFLMINMTIAVVVILLTLVLALVKSSDYEKASPFECGFIPHNPMRTFFSLHFFAISLLFLVFDVELVLLFPMLLNNQINSPILHSSVMCLFVLMLIVGALWEWSQKILKWSEFLWIS